MKFPTLKIALLTGVAVVALASAAQAAAPMSSSSSTSGAYNDCYNWSGFYAGGHIGGIWGDFNSNVPVTAGPTGDAGSIMGGLQVGYNFQWGNFVAGAEGDFSWIDLEGSSAAGSFREKWQTTWRGRFGYTLGRIMPYGTVGFAITESESHINAADSDDTHFGLAAGAGVDIGLKDGWSTRLEYLYVSVPEESSTISGTTVRGGSDNHVLRVGFNYHFNSM